MPPFQLFIKLKYGREGEVERRAITVGAVGLGERVCRVGWVGCVGEGEIWQIYVRVGWGLGLQDIRNSPLTLTLPTAPQLTCMEIIDVSSSSDVEEEEEEEEVQTVDIRTVEEEEEV